MHNVSSLNPPSDVTYLRGESYLIANPLGGGKVRESTTSATLRTRLKSVVTFRYTTLRE